MHYDDYGTEEHLGWRSDTLENSISQYKPQNWVPRQQYFYHILSISTFQQLTSLKLCLNSALGWNLEGKKHKTAVHWISTQYEYVIIDSF